MIMDRLSLSLHVYHGRHMTWMVHMLRHYTLRLQWTADNMGKLVEFWYESCPRCRFDHSTCWPPKVQPGSLPLCCCSHTRSSIGNPRGAIAITHRHVIICILLQDIMQIRLWYIIDNPIWHNFHLSTYGKFYYVRPRTPINHFLGYDLFHIGLWSIGRNRLLTILVSRDHRKIIEI